MSKRVNQTAIKMTIKKQNRCNELERWILEKGYIRKMVSKQILWACESSRVSLLDKVKSESNEQKLTSNIMYCSLFRNIRSILQELSIRFNTRSGT